MASPFNVVVSAGRAHSVRDERDYPRCGTFYDHPKSASRLMFTTEMYTLNLVHNYDGDDDNCHCAAQPSSSKISIHLAATFSYI